MSSFEEKKDELAALGVSVYAAAVDPEEKSKEVADSGVSFPLAHGVTREIGEKLGSWWDDRRDFIQPSEFVMSRDGTIMCSSYSSSRLARTDPGDVISLLKFIESRRKKREAERG